MMNNFILIGKLSTITEVENGIIITIRVPRNYKNENGIYEYDFVDCYCWNGVANKMKEYCKADDTIGVKGRVETTFLKGEKTMKLITEKVTFLSSNPNLKKEDE